MKPAIIAAIGGMACWLWICGVLWLCYKVDPWRAETLQWVICWFGVLGPVLVVGSALVVLTAPTRPRDK